MSLLTIFIIINVNIAAIKTKNLDPTKETYKNDFDDHYMVIIFKDSSINEINFLTTEHVSVTKIPKTGEVNLKEALEIKPSHRIRRSTFEDAKLQNDTIVENKTSLVAPKPLRLIRRRVGSVNEEEHLKHPLNSANKYLNKPDLLTNDLMRSNTDAYSLQERNDNTNDTNDWNNKTENAYSDINKDVQRNMNSYPNNLFGMRLFDNNSSSNQTKHPIVETPRNSNLRAKGIIEMPSKYISVVKDPKTITFNAKKERTSIGDPTPGDTVMSEEEIIESYDTEVIEQYYDNEPNLSNTKSFKSNKNINHDLSEAKKRFDHQLLMNRNEHDDSQNQPNHIRQKLLSPRPRYQEKESDTGFVGKQYYGNYPYQSLINTHQKFLLRESPRQQEMMDENGTRFVGEQYYEDYPYQPFNTHKKIRAKPMERSDTGFIGEQYNEDFPYQPFNMHQKLLIERPRQQEAMEEKFVGDQYYKDYPYQPFNTQQKLLKAKPLQQDQMHDSGTGFVGDQYYEEYPYQPFNTKQKLIQTRPKLDQHENLERSGNRFVEEEYDEEYTESNSTYKLVPEQYESYHSIQPSNIFYNKLFIVDQESDPQDREKNDAKIKTKPYIKKLNGDIKYIRPRFNDQEVEKKISGVIKGELNNEELNKQNIKSLKNHGYTHPRLLGEQPKIYQQEPIEKNEPLIVAEQYDKDFMRPKIKYFENNVLESRNDDGNIANQYFNEDLNRPKINKMVEVNGDIRYIRPKLNHQESIENNSDKIKSEQYENQNHPNIETNKNIFYKLLEVKPMERNSNEITGKQYNIEDLSQPYMKSLDLNVYNTSQKLLEERTSHDLQGFINQKIIKTEQNDGDQNQLNIKHFDKGNRNIAQNLSNLAEKSSKEKPVDVKESKILSDHYDEYSYQINMNSGGENANSDKRLHENIEKSEKELMRRNYATEPKTFMNNSNTNADDKLSEEVKSILEVMNIDDINRHRVGPEEYKEQWNNPTLKYFEVNAHKIPLEERIQMINHNELRFYPTFKYFEDNAHKTPSKVRSDRPINSNSNENIFYPRLVHSIPKVVIPRFSCRNVRSCGKIYMPKCSKLRIKCGLMY